MTGKIAAWLITLSQFAGLAGAFMLAADSAPFGVDAHDVGLALVWFGQFASFAVIAIRRNLIPGVETGIASEKGST